jgi:hypothetical protein
MADDKIGKPEHVRLKRSSTQRVRSSKRRAETEMASPFEVLLDRRVPVRMQGRDKNLTIEEALFYRTYQDALGGDRMAIRTVVDRINQREGSAKSIRPNLPAIRCEWLDPAPVDDALLILRIATQSEGRARDNGRPFLQLEPWAVELGFARANLPLGETILRELKAQTRDPDTVAWRSGGDE